MAIARNTSHSDRAASAIWPGFVDAMTALLLVLMFVLTIFMIVQFVLQETISGQENQLDTLNTEVDTLNDDLASLSSELALLGQSLGLERARTARLESDLENAQNQIFALGDLRSQLETERDALIASGAAQSAKIEEYEIEVARLLAQSADQSDQISTLRDEKALLQEENRQEVSAKEALERALASTKEALSESEVAARLLETRREALEVLIASLEADAQERDALIQSQAEEIAQKDAAADQAELALSEVEQNLILEAEAAALLRERLKTSGAELTAMSLALESERKKAEETLTLLAAQEAANKKLESDLSAQEDESKRQNALLNQANAILKQEKEISSEAQKQLVVLNAQSAGLRRQLNQLQGLLDIATEKDREAQVRLEVLGQNLNVALARAASEQKRRAELEEENRKRLEEEAKELANFRSEFFGKMRKLLEDRDNLRIVGDRFVFASEVLFEPGSAELGETGKEEIAGIAQILLELAADIPHEIDWVLQVDGHTDNVPIVSQKNFANNWELSQARALSVVRFLSEEQELPPERLSANGFGEFQPIDKTDTPEGRAKNRRIELKLTEK